MVQREGVGATITAAVLFSVLIFSSLVVFSTSANQEMLASEANEVGLLNDGAQISASVYGLRLLDQAQGLLGSRAWQCSTAMSSIREGISSFVSSDDEASGPIHGNATVIQGSDLVDDLPLERPFNGSMPGYFTIELDLKASETGAGGVSYHASQHELLSIPARLTSLISLCESSILVVKTAILNPFAGCNESLLRAEVSDAVAPLVKEASSQGLRLSVSLSVNGGSRCSLWIVASVSQSGIQGPDGTFTLRVEQEERLSVQPQD